MIIPIICFTEKLAESSMRLVEYCRRLDGTNVIPIEVPVREQNPKQDYKDSLSSVVFNYAARVMRGYSFFWLEHDSIPLRPKWLLDIEFTYDISGMPYMMTSDSHPTYDISSGIGVYGPNTHREIPSTFDERAWDFWMVENISKRIHFCSLIQHSYGIYGDDGNVKDWHRFPRDQSMLRKDAVIFHKDDHQDLIK